MFIYLIISISILVTNFNLAIGLCDIFQNLTWNMFDAPPGCGTDNFHLTHSDMMDKVLATSSGNDDSFSQIQSVALGVAQFPVTLQDCVGDWLRTRRSFRMVNACFFFRP